MRAVLAQIKAIASHAVAHNGEGPTYRDSELLTIRQALADAVASVDDHLRWRQLARQERAHEARLQAERSDWVEEGLFG
jgi:hypothetical protein